MLIDLRAARPDDFDFCARLYFSGMADIIRQLKLDMAAQTANLRERWNVSEVRIITCDEADIGWIQSSVQDDALYLEQIFIDPAFQRGGIGTEIIYRLIARAVQAGQPVTLGVVKTNPARHLYERLGFRITSEDDLKFYMRRELEQSVELPVISGLLDWDDVALPDSVSEANLDAIIFSALHSQWRKTAMVVGTALTRCQELTLPVSAEMIGARVRALADTARLEGQGDLRKWRHSEVRLKD
jgi:ribosomal protein S18 acetylase RimI-like enzyme